MNRRELLSGAAAGISLMATSRLQAAEDSSEEKAITYRVREILGATIEIDGGKSVGTVDDLVLDSHGNVDYLIVLNDDDKYVTIPWDATQFNVEKKVASVKITPKKNTKKSRSTRRNSIRFTRRRPIEPRRTSTLDSPRGNSAG